MDKTLLENLSLIWPSILMGAIIPCGVLIGLLFTKKKKQVAYNAALWGFGGFFIALVLVAVLVLIIAQAYMPTITADQASNANIYIYVGGCIILALFYLITEGMKQFSFRYALKSDNPEFAGLTFGSGFILAQNLLIIGLFLFGEVDLAQSLVFGLFMIISGVIYILLSLIGYQLKKEGNWKAGSAIAIVYYLILAIMLVVANVYVTYITIAAVLIFIIALGYFMLPKKGKENK